MLLIAQDQETLRVESPIEASDPRFADYAASLVGAAVEPGDVYAVLRNGDAFPPMLDAIEKARTRINFETYVFKDGTIGEQFLRAFERAASRGVTVRLVLDPLGSALSWRSQQRLDQAGVKPLRFWTLEETNYRTHRKVLVVNGAVAFIGGTGIADQWLGHAQDPEPPPRPTGARSVVLWSNPTAGASNVKLLHLLATARRGRRWISSRPLSRSMSRHAGASPKHGSAACASACSPTVT